LKELTGLTDVHLEQFAAFGDLDRLKKERDQIWLKAIRKDPDVRVLTVAYYALVAVDKIYIDQDAWKSLPGWYGKKPRWLEYMICLTWHSTIKKSFSQPLIF